MGKNYPDIIGGFDQADARHASGHAEGDARVRALADNAKASGVLDAKTKELIAMAF